MLVKVLWSKRSAELICKGEQVSEVMWLDTKLNQYLPNYQLNFGEEKIKGKVAMKNLKEMSGAELLAEHNRLLNEMSGAELLAEYNRLSPTKRKAKFETKTQAIAKITALKPQGAEVTPEEVTAEPAKVDMDENSKSSSSKKTSPRDESVIRTTVDSNPRREGSAGHSYFEAMKGSPTVSEYLGKFEDHRKARQWLANTVRDGYVKIIG